MSMITQGVSPKDLRGISQRNETASDHCNTFAIRNYKVSWFSEQVAGEQKHCHPVLSTDLHILWTCNILSTRLKKNCKCFIFPISLTREGSTSLFREEPSRIIAVAFVKQMNALLFISQTFLNSPFHPASCLKKPRVAWSSTPGAWLWSWLWNWFTAWPLSPQGSLFFPQPCHLLSLLDLIQMKDCFLLAWTLLLSTEEAWYKPESFNASMMQLFT